VAGEKPTTGSNTLNSLNVLTFDGGDDLIRTSSVSLPEVSTGVTVVAVRKFTSGTAGGILRVSDSGANGDSYTLGRDLGVMGIWGDRFNSSASTSATFSDSDNTNWNISSATHTNLSGRTIYHNGTSRGSNGLNCTAALVGYIQLGVSASQDRASTRFFTGQIAEVFVLDGVGATNRQKIEGYTAWKWGLQGSLDAGHPYKSAAP
jgi:hypothetical protein